MSETILERLQRFGIATWSILGGVGVVAVSVWLIAKVSIIWPPVVIAVAIVLLLNPMVDRLHGRGLPRAAGTAIAYVIFVGLVALAGFLIVPIVIEQGARFGEAIPELVDDVSAWLITVGERFNLDLDVSARFEELVSTLADRLTEQQLGELVGAGFEFLRTGFEVLLFFVLAPVLAFYLLVDLPNIKGKARDLVPADYKAEVAHVAHQISKALGGFVRGQLVVALIVAILSSAGLRIINLPFWLVIGIIAGLLNMVPFIGPWVGGLLAVLVALLLGDVGKAFWAALIFLGVQQIDNHFVSPTVLRVTVKLHPFIIIVVLIIGGSLGGLLGVLLAVPITAVVKIVTGHVWRTRVLGESWEEAAEAMLVEAEPPSTDRLVGRLRRIRDLQVSRVAGSGNDHGDGAHAEPEGEVPVEQPPPSPPGGRAAGG